MRIFSPGGTLFENNFYIPDSFILKNKKKPTKIVHTSFYFCLFSGLPWLQRKKTRLDYSAWNCFSFAMIYQMSRQLNAVRDFHRQTQGYLLTLFIYGIGIRII